MHHEVIVTSRHRILSVTILLTRTLQYKTSVCLASFNRRDLPVFFLLHNFSIL